MGGRKGGREGGMDDGAEGTQVKQREQAVHCYRFSPVSLAFTSIATKQVAL